MATYIDSLPRNKQGRLLAGAGPFHRRGRADSLRKGLRRRTLRTKHVLGAAILLGAAFFGASRVYLFLVSWDRLTIRHVELAGGRPSVKESLERYFTVRPLGNMLLCDVESLQAQIKTLSWVKDVRVQKVFPETLRIEVDERVPFVLIEFNGTFLADEDGVLLQAADSGADWPLPVVRDENGFRDHFLEKWQTARACLADMSPAQVARLASLECSNDGRITLHFREDAVELVVDGTAVRSKIDFFDAHRAAWESQFGALASVDLRLDDRVVVLPQGQESQGLPATSAKEAQ